MATLVKSCRCSLDEFRAVLRRSLAGESCTSQSEVRPARDIEIHSERRGPGGVASGARERDVPASVTVAVVVESSGFGVETLWLALFAVAWMPRLKAASVIHRSVSSILANACPSNRGWLIISTGMLPRRIGQMSP